jgi:hypothetical protein
MKQFLLEMKAGTEKDIAQQNNLTGEVNTC